MGVQKRRRQREIVNAKNQGRPTNIADIESEYLAKADEPLLRTVMNTKAFNVMWIQFFKLFALVALFANVWVGIRSFSNQDFPQLLFSAVSVVTFATGINWLSSVDVILSDEDGGLFGNFTNELKLFILVVAAQVLLLPLFYVTGHPEQTIFKCFPTGLVFMCVAFSVVAFMRWNLKQKMAYRINLSKKLFNH